MLVSFMVLLVASLTFPQNKASADSLSAFCRASSKVGVQFLKSAQGAVAGADFPIMGRLINVNNFPMDDVSIVVQAVKMSGSTGSAYDLATDTVARFVPVSGLNIQASSTAYFSFKWPIPVDLPTGQYRIDIFAESSGQFPIVGQESAGLVTAAYPISVISQAKETSYFDRNSVSVNGTKAPTGQASVSGAVPANVSVDILNTHAKPKDGILVWKIYSSDIASAENLVDAKTETVSMSPGKKATASISIPKIDDPAYFVIGELKDGGKSSFVSVRIARSDMSKPSFTMLGILPFPLKLGGTATFFGCLTKSTLTDENSKTIFVSITGSDGSMVYYGKPSVSETSVGGFFGNFLVPKAGWQTLRMVANIADKSGAAAVSSAISYSCNGPECSPQALAAGSTTTAVYYLLALSIIAVLIILAIILIKRRGKAPRREDQTDHA
jgi:hypothetical protein